MRWWGWASLGVIVVFLGLGAVSCLCCLRQARRAPRRFHGVKPARPDATTSPEVHQMGAPSFSPNACDQRVQNWMPAEHRPQFVTGCRALVPYEPTAAAPHTHDHTPLSLQLGRGAEKGWMVGQDARTADSHGHGMSSHRVDYLEDRRSAQPTRSRPPRQSRRGDGSTAGGQRRRSGGVSQILDTLRGSFGSVRV